MSSESQLKSYLESIKQLSIDVIPCDQVLLESQIPKGNSVLSIETSVLFVDIRKSSSISQNIGIKNMTKLYKMFSSLAAMAIQENSGKIFQFAGDGFMAAFNSTKSSNFRLNAFNAAIRIKYLLDNVYKSIVDNNWLFDCGYAISTGHIYMTRLKAKPYDLPSFGVFPGEPTNLSSKLCDFAKENEIIIDQSTYDHLKKFDINFIRTSYKDKVVYKCKLK